MTQFSKNTLAYFKNNTDNIPPKNNRTILFNIIKPFLQKNIDILEPSAKTGEFILDLNEFDISFNIISNEDDPQFLDTLQNIPNSNTIPKSFLALSSPHNFRKFDLILGSPPSFIIDKKTPIGKKFRHWFVLKTNIYSIYLSRSIDLLRNDGIIAFILPDTILNSPYLQFIRNKISKTGSILHLQRLSNLFTKTTYNTILLVYQKKILSKNKFVFNAFNNKLFTFDFTLYKSLYSHSNNLHILKSTIYNGNCYNSLERSNNNLHCPIIYNKNIGPDNRLRLFPKSKKQYVDPVNLQIYTKPSIVISQICGNKKDPYMFNFAICTLDNYIVQESLYVITFPKLNNEDAVILLYKIVRSFNNDNTKKWIKHFIKDGLISKFQLLQYLPIQITTSL